LDKYENLTKYQKEYLFNVSW